MHRALLSALALAVFTSISLGDSPAKTYGKAPTVKEPTPISMVKAEPVKFKDQVVLLTGTIVDVCKHRGCWVEIESGDSSRIICKSLDETILFPKDVLGRTIQLQGKVMYDAKAPGVVTEKHEGGEAHSCPAPQVLVSIEGATVAGLAVTDSVSPEPEPKKE